MSTPEDQLTQIADENVAPEMDGGINYLVNSAMMRLGMMPPSYALYNPPPSFAEGGSTDDVPDTHSSLAKLHDAVARLLGPISSRYATGVAKQLYGLDKDGNLVLGGRAWTEHQGGTPTGILDQFASLPAHIIPLLNQITAGGPKEPGNEPIPVPDWSSAASDRLASLERKVGASTGVGDPHTLPEHLADAAAMLTTPMPAAKVAREAPAAQRLLEMLMPLRPPSAARFATDTAGLGGASKALDMLRERLAARQAPQQTAPPEAVDPQIEKAALDYTNAQYADGGKVISLVERLAQLAEKAKAATGTPTGGDQMDKYFRDLKSSQTRPPSQYGDKGQLFIENYPKSVPEPPKDEFTQEPIPEHFLTNHPDYGKLAPVTDMTRRRVEQMFEEAVAKSHNPNDTFEQALEKYQQIRDHFDKMLDPMAGAEPPANDPGFAEGGKVSILERLANLATLPP